MAYNYEQVASQSTGLRLDDEKLEKFNAKRVHEAELDRQIADRLTRLGADVYERRVDDITFVNAVDCAAKKRSSSNLKNQNFIPSKMRADRSQWINDCEYYLQTHPAGDCARMLVATAGKRVPFGPNFEEEMSGAIKGLLESLKDWRYDVAAPAGVEVVLRTVECPATDAKGGHGHVNVIIIPPLMTPRKWSLFLSETRKALKHHVKDCGRIRNIREAIKYICKVEGSEGLLSLNDANFMSMYKVFSSQKAIGTSDGFKQFRAELKKAKERIVRKNNQLVRMTIDGRSPRSQDTNITPGDAGPEENVYLGRTLPFPDESGLIQPRLIVKNYDPNPTTGVGRQRLTAIMSMVERAREWAAANGHDCSAYNVHTTTSNVLSHHEAETNYTDERGSPSLRPTDERHVNVVHPPPPRGVGCQHKRRIPISAPPMRRAVYRVVEIDGQMRRIAAKPEPKPGDRHEDGRVWVNLGGRRGGRWVRLIQPPRLPVQQPKQPVRVVPKAEPKPGDRHEDGRVWVNLGGRRGGRWVRPIQQPVRPLSQPVSPPSPVQEYDVVDPQWLAMRWAGQQDISEVANWMIGGSGGVAGPVGDCPF